MLAYYAARFDTVEVNNTFYRMPSADVLTRWAGEVPDGFTFALKAPQRITHQKRLADVSSAVTYFLETSAVLGPKRGPVLYQLPPYSKKDIDRLRAFLDLLPATPPAAFEFRHASWFDDEVREALRARDAALCLADTDEAPITDLVSTAGWGYLRLRRTAYTPEDLRAWADRLRAQPWSDAYVFLKHEDEGKGPEFASALKAHFSPP
jgi:uncharacterized protein YecE (DUF72 family)